ncbi:type IV pilus biogenesis protein PilM [Rossellomorea vietnamensis]|uniref:type IV pilus biogenesis protein PilM n=1 Tax=Rossellomorea vietnamensis TaxID=218284 RepID=UPI003CF277F7
MNFGLFGNNNRIANLVITDTAIRYADLKMGSPLVVQNYGEKLLPQGVITDGKIIEYDTLAMILEECIYDWGIKKRQVRFIVPSTSIIVKRVLVPGDIAEDELKGYLFMEIGTSIHLPFEDPLFDVVKLGDKDDKQEILLVASPEEVIHSYRDILDEVKLKPVAADISPLALYRFFYQTDMVRSAAHEMILQFDEKLLTISIFHRNQPIFLRPISFQGDIDLPDSSPDLDRGGIFYLEDTFKEIEKVFSFYKYSLNKGEVNVNNVILTGDHPYLNEIYQSLSERLSAAVHRAPQDSMLDAKGQSVPGYYDLAVGLALKEVL